MAKEHITALLVEDNPGDAKLIEVALAEAPGGSIVIQRVDRLAAGLERLAGGGIDVVLLDLSLPDSHGIETFERLHAHASNVPIVILSGSSDESLAVRAVNAGAQDYLVKGRGDGETLHRAIRYAVERHNNMNELEQLAAVDELTGLRNRRAFLMLGEQDLKTARRTGLPRALIFVDVNEMKVINDRFGHHEGDRALKDAADVLRMTFRDSDILGRIGGDEFSALIQVAPDFDPEVLARRIDQNLAHLRAARERPYQLSLSVGAHRYDPETPCSLEELMKSADELMYRHKMDDVRRPRLMIVDDDPAIRRLIEVLLADQYDVTPAGNAAEAIAGAKDHGIDMFLIDVRLPDKPGTELARALRSDPVHHRTPIIMLTGMRDDAIEIESLRIGVEDFVRKPFHPEAFVSRVGNAIARSKRR